LDNIYTYLKKIWKKKEIFFGILVIPVAGFHAAYCKFAFIYSHDLRRLTFIPFK